MKYIIMCGGKYRNWQTPRQLLEVEGEPIVARTIRLLHEAGIEDIAISSNNPEWFNDFGVPVLVHDNSYDARGYNDSEGYWCDAFYPMDEPACYLFGDVIFSPEAIRMIVDYHTETIMLFGSKVPFAPEYACWWPPTPNPGGEAGSGGSTWPVLTGTHSPRDRGRVSP